MPILAPDLAGLCGTAHEEALNALDVAGADPLHAVAWLSAHLAAAELVLHPAAARVPRARPLLRRQTLADRRVHAAVWCLDRRLTGDLRSARRRVDDCVQDVRTALHEHVRLEDELLRVLHGAGADLDLLATRLAEATERAPTRPHPHAPQSGLPGRLAFRVEGLVDAVRDALDTRRSPAPRRVTRPRPVSRYAAYLAGQPRTTPAPGTTDGGRSRAGLP